jgi:intergrase/recombinase
MTQSKMRIQPLRFLPGFITSVRVRCGKPNCRCNRGARHIAYYHVTYSRGFRFRKYVRRDQVAEARAACEAYRTLQGLLRAGRAEYKRTLANMRELMRRM